MKSFAFKFNLRFEVFVKKIFNINLEVNCNLLLLQCWYKLWLFFLYCFFSFHVFCWDHIWIQFLHLQWLKLISIKSKQRMISLFCYEHDRGESKNCRVILFWFNVFFLIWNNLQVDKQQQLCFNSVQNSQTHLEISEFIIMTSTHTFFLSYQKYIVNSSFISVQK